MISGEGGLLKKVPLPHTPSLRKLSEIFFKKGLTSLGGCAIISVLILRQQVPVKAATLSCRGATFFHDVYHVWSFLGGGVPSREKDFFMLIFTIGR